MTACASGDDALSSGELTAARQGNIDEVTWLAARTVPDPFDVSESILGCQEAHSTTLQGSYGIRGKPSEHARRFIDGPWTQRMKNHHWRLTEPDPPEGGYERTFTKDGRTVGITLHPAKGTNDPVAFVEGLTPCGQIGDLETGDVEPHGPGYLEPRVAGPRMTPTRQ